MRPVLTFMGFLFKEEGSSSSQSICSLIGPANPLCQMLEFVFNRLHNLQDGFWALLTYKGWNVFRLQIVLDTFLAIAAACFWRVKCTLDRYPWLLWLIVDPARPLGARRTSAEKFRAACDECLDPYFSLVVRQTWGVDALLDDTTDACCIVRESFEQCPASNIMSELRFARIKKLLASGVSGRAHAASTMASKHVLSELAAVHARACDRLGRFRPEPVPPAPDPSPKAKSSWHKFLSQKRKEGKTMQEAAKAWSAMSPSEKAEWEQGEQVVERSPTEVKDADDHELKDTLHVGLGNAEFPLRDEIVAGLCRGPEIKIRSAEWKNAYGKLIKDPANQYAASEPLPLRCSERFGWDRCVTKIDGEQLATYEKVLSTIRKAATTGMTDRKSANLRLLRVKTDDRQGKFVLSCFHLAKNPEVVVFLEFSVVSEHDADEPIGAGALLVMRPRAVDFFCLDVTFAWDVLAYFRDGALGVDIASYVPETFTDADDNLQIALRLTGLDPHGGLKVAEEKGEKVPDEVKAAFSAMRCVSREDGATKRARSKGSTSAKRKSPKPGPSSLGKGVAKAAEDGGDGRDDAGCAAGAGPDDRDGDHPAVARADDDDNSGSSSSGSDEDYLDREERSEWKAAARVCQVDVATEDAGPASSSSSSSRPSAPPPPPRLPPPPLPPPPMLPPVSETMVASADAEDPLPVLVNGWATVGAERLGRINYLWRSPTSSQMMVYCRKHGCYKSMAGSRAPFESGALKWLSYGWSAACKSKADHVEQFNRFVLSP